MWGYVVKNIIGM